MRNVETLPAPVIATVIFSGFAALHTIGALERRQRGAVRVFVDTEAQNGAGPVQGASGDGINMLFRWVVVVRP